MDRAARIRDALFCAVTVAAVTHPIGMADVQAPPSDPVNVVSVRVDVGFKFTVL